MYVAVPLGTFRNEIASFEAAASVDAIRRVLLPGTAPDVVHLTGQADLLLQLRVTNFRPIVNLEYPSESSDARVFNMVFSVRYKSTGANRTKEDLGGPRLRFNVHLRVRRGVYAAVPVHRETQIVQVIRDVLQSDKVSLEVAAGFGWADLIADGTLAADSLADFSDRLLRLHAATISLPNGRHPVFERTLTLLGYERSDSDSDASSLRPLLIIRGLPGRLEDLKTALFTSLGLTDSPTFVIDGKADVVVPVNEPIPDLLRRHSALCNGLESETLSDRREHPIQRLETHLIYKNAGRVRDAATAVPNAPCIDPGAESLSANDGLPCDCPERIPRSRVSHTLDVFPSELRLAIGNVRQLFRASLSERTSCCDLSGAVIAGENGLFALSIELGQRIRRSQRARGTNGEEEAHAALLDQHKQIEIWGLLAERILRQRTVGSFEELLGQIDRAIAYRGGVQRFLCLADALMNDFARTVRDGLGLSEPSAPAFASLYDTVNEIRSVRGTGFIRIPVKNLFRLPLVLPDLWHEVGIYYFFSNPRFQFDDVLKDYPRAALPAHELARIVEFFYRDLGDQYADAIAFLYGFQGRPARFALSLVRGWLESNKTTEHAPNVRQRLYKQLLVRLYTIATLHRARQRTNRRPGRSSLDHAKCEITMLDGFIFEQFGTRTPAGSKATIDAAAKYVTSYIYDRWVRDRLIRDLAQASVRISPRGPLEDEIREGRLRGFGETVDLNAVFGRFYWFREVLRSRATDSTEIEIREGHELIFRAMAALGRSATLEYHRREAVTPRLSPRSTT